MTERRRLRESPRVTLRQAAALLGVHEETARRWVREKKLPHYKVGRRVILDRAELERVFALGRVEVEGVPLVEGATRVPGQEGLVLDFEEPTMREITAQEFLRYLRWRVMPLREESFQKLIYAFGTDPILVDAQGGLSSPGGRGARG